MLIDGDKVKKWMYDNGDIIESVYNDFISKADSGSFAATPSEQFIAGVMASLDAINKASEDFTFDSPLTGAHFYVNYKPLIQQAVYDLLRIDRDASWRR